MAVNELDTLSMQLGEALLARGWRLATAESCTGGWVAQAVTAIAGSSNWFDRGFVTYSNEAKQDMLAVRADSLARHGAVSEAVVREMVAGALARSRADLALAISGIAGPTGGSAEKPVGTVWIAWGLRDGVQRAQRFHFDGDRTAVRRQSVLAALQGGLSLLQSN
ncbi:nicotinamide-nucleotide amidase [Sulfuritortus calidifontis]|uniref:Nicotinamide-nucleotide amidase n=1 Tax=Sulfuritortus calidifontis TaxID=1914471 RepID=A0A4R3JXU7_9PROT|nr:nicotinamide-nucleotide amidase [Sulfuritortus calidifontis]TCS72352.1 nicotinamide-nucleotide amidase [Sulfuritortus calidifontis]